MHILGTQLTHDIMTLGDSKQHLRSGVHVGSNFYWNPLLLLLINPYNTILRKRTSRLPHLLAHNNAERLFVSSSKFRNRYWAGVCQPNYLFLQK